MSMRMEAVMKENTTNGSHERHALELLVLDEEVFGADLLDLLARGRLRGRLGRLALYVALLRRVQQRRRHAAHVQVRLGLHRRLRLFGACLRLLPLALLLLLLLLLRRLRARLVLAEPFPQLLLSTAFTIYFMANNINIRIRVNTGY